jgi:hypothetical protein
LPQKKEGKKSSVLLKHLFMIAQVNRTGLNICELTYAHYIFFLSAVFTVPFTKVSYLHNLIKKN